MKKAGIKVIALMIMVLMMNGLQLSRVEAANTPTLKNGDRVYVKKSEKDALYQFSIKNDSIVTLSADIYDFEEIAGWRDSVKPEVYILNSKKKAVLTAIKKDYILEEPYSYFLKKGTYYVKVVGPAGYLNQVEELNKDCNWAFRQ